MLLVFEIVLFTKKSRDRSIDQTGNDLSVLNGLKIPGLSNLPSLAKNPFHSFNQSFVSACPGFSSVPTLWARRKDICSQPETDTREVKAGDLTVAKFYLLVMRVSRESISRENLAESFPAIFLTHFSNAPDSIYLPRNLNF